MANIWQGERVRLRAIEPEDWPSFRRDGVQFTEDARLYDDRVQAPNSEEQARTRMTQWAEATPESDDRTLAIIDMNNELVGSISAHHCERLAGTFEFSLGIFHEHRRHGYAAEAIRILVRYYFEELRYQKVNSTVYAFNNPSLQLLQQMGFIEEGRRRRAGYTAGEFHDNVLLGMTIEEFYDQHGAPAPALGGS